MMKTRLTCILISIIILVTSFTAAGEWNQEKRLTYSGTAGSQTIIKDSEDNTHILYHDSENSHYMIKHMTLDKTGNIENPGKTIISGTGNSIFPCAVIHEESIEIIWWDNRDGNYRLYYASFSLDGSRQNPDKPLILELEQETEPIESPEMDIDRHGNKYIVWSSRYTNDEIDSKKVRPTVYFMKIDPVGEIISPPFRISSGYGNALQPDIAVDILGRAHVVWSEDITGSYEIYYRIIRDMDNRDEQEYTQLTDSGSESLMSDILFHQGNLYICWCDSQLSGNNYAVFLGKISSNGLSYNYRLSYKGNALEPSMATDGNDIFVCWQDDRHSSENSNSRKIIDRVKDNLTETENRFRCHLFGDQVIDTKNELVNWEIYFCITDGRGKIIRNDTRVTEKDHASIHPKVVSDKEGAANIIWIDMSESSGDIFYIDNVEKESGLSSIPINSEEASLMILGTFGLLIFIYLFSGEGRRYALIKILGLPMYSTLSREKVLNNENRRNILDLITKENGITFTSLMKDLGLKNGALAYHLSILEKRRFIRSVKDGKYRRFFPKGVKITGLSSVEEKIKDVIEKKPSISQTEIAREIDSTPQTVNYNIKKLMKKGDVYLEKDGKHTRCYLKGVSNGF